MQYRCNKTIQAYHLIPVLFKMGINKYLRDIGSSQSDLTPGDSGSNNKANWRQSEKRSNNNVIRTSPLTVRFLSVRA